MSNDNQTATKPGPRVYDSKVPPLDWRPEPSAGVRLTGPTVEVAAWEYDAFATAMIADLGPTSPEAQLAANAQKRGWVLEHKGRRVYMKGRG